jgi:hypothetical protein
MKYNTALDVTTADTQSHSVTRRQPGVFSPHCPSGVAPASDGHGEGVLGLVCASCAQVVGMMVPHHRQLLRMLSYHIIYQYYQIYLYE